jgi:hypothetical protein
LPVALGEESFLEDVTGMLGFLAAQRVQRSRAKADAKGRITESDEAIDAVIAKTRSARRRAK